MNTIRRPGFSRSISALSPKWCIALVWMAVLYSRVIQFKVMEISNALLIIGVFMIGTFLLSQPKGRMDLKKVITKESAWLLIYMAYQLVSGLFTSPKTADHISQWITSMEYLIIMIVISSLIMTTGSETFYMMLLVTAVILAVLFILDPVTYGRSTSRFSLAQGLNPNGLGMALTSGIWAALYFQQKKRIPLIVALGVIALFLYDIFMTGSRKALIAAAIVIVLWFALAYVPNVLKDNSRWKILTLFFSFIVIAVAGFFLLRMYLNSSIEARIINLSKEMTTGSRALLYRLGWKLFRESPVFGLGFQGFKYYSVYYSHATVVEVPVSGGIIGTVLYSISYYVSIKRCLSIYKYCRRRRELRAELTEIKMLLSMWAAMIFYCTCIIHPYQFDSFITFGVIFGQSVFIERKLRTIRKQ